VPESSGPITNLRQRMIGAVAALTGLALRNAQLVQHVRHHAVRDPLTGCLTRAYGLDQIDAELRRARRSQMPVSVIMFDIDHLKTINERRGLACGDAVLRAVGARLQELLRGSDIRCRYGGEEFADLSLMWQTELVTATASFGVAIALPGEVDAQAIIARAEAALDRAKDQGTNSVRLIGEPIVA
jgi:GGDEF domain-containing protein